MDKTRQALIDYAQEFIDYTLNFFEEYGVEIQSAKIKNLGRYVWSGEYGHGDNRTYLDFEFLIKFGSSADMRQSDGSVLTKVLTDLCNDFFKDKSHPYPLKDRAIDKIERLRCEPFGKKWDSSNNAQFIFSVRAMEVLTNLGPSWGNTIEDVAKGIGKFKPVNTYIVRTDNAYADELDKIKVKLSEKGYGRDALSYKGTFKYWDRFNDLHLDLRYGPMKDRWGDIHYIFGVRGLERAAEYKSNPDIILLWAAQSRAGYNDGSHQAYLVHRKDYDKILKAWDKKIDITNNDRRWFEEDDDDEEWPEA